MFKLSQFLLSRSPISEQLLLRKAGTKDVICLHNLTSRAGISTAGNYSDRVFADYTLFKGKAFLSVRPNLPELSRLDSGDSKVSRRGCIFLTFCPAVGQRKYDYEKRQIFSLSPTEVGALISLGPNDSCEFFHDPSIQTSNAGQLRKSLSVSSLPSTGGSSTGGYMFSLNVINNNLKTNERFSVPVTIAEFAVMRTAFSFALPHIMGWNWLSNQAKTSKDGYNRRTPTLMSSDLEWEK